MRRGFIVTIGGLGLVVLAIVALSTLRSSKETQGPAVAAAPEASATDVPVAEPQPEVAATPANPAFPIPKLGVLKAKPQMVRAPDSPLNDIKLTFKLDPRGTASLYMGDRWVCPPTYYRTGEGPECSFEATIQGINTHGKATRITPTITAADPSMVTVSPGPGKTVQITVHRAGQTTLDVAALGLSKKLPLNAQPYGPTLAVEVYQQ